MLNLKSGKGIKTLILALSSNYEMLRLCISWAICLRLGEYNSEGFEPYSVKLSLIGGKKNQ